MGRALAERFPESREAFERGDAALGFPISKLCFEGPAEELALTENTQPAMLASSVAALRALESRGLAPAAAAGHSLGEYAAHVAAGTLSLDDALRTVRARGRFMQETVPVGVGAMAAILGLDPRRVVALCAEAAEGEVVEAANFNGPTQVVIAGHTAAVERASERARAAGGKAVTLPVSAPFHCSLMRPAAERLRPVLAEVSLRDPAFPVWANVDAAPVETAAAAGDALARQVDSPVRWQETIEGMLADGVEAFVEVGPGRVLAGLVRGIAKGVPVLPAGDPDGVERAAAELGR
jgi:[acyl-carrier-protein] S-malonyltransferase